MSKMVVGVYGAITGCQQKAGGVSLSQGHQRSYLCPLSLFAKALAKTSVKMLVSIFMVLCIFVCAGYTPKPFAAKGFNKCDNGLQISTPFKSPYLLKPFINAYLAVSKFGMRHPKAVSHFVSFLRSNVMGIWTSALSQSGKVGQVKGVSQTVSFFAQRDLTTLKKLSNLRIMVYWPSGGRLFYVRSFFLWTMDYQPWAKCYPARHLYQSPKQLTMEKRIFGVILLVLGIIGLIMAGAGFMHSSGGTYSIKSIILYGLLGLVFFSAGVRMITNTADKAT